MLLTKLIVGASKAIEIGFANAIEGAIEGAIAGSIRHRSSHRRGPIGLTIAFQPPTLNA